ncbi:MAG TPA: PadR family transcriptional regulator [Acidimicrobiales bacterium]|nr:PadR family transcriptional regulator [Acidimicrobiales bacterium]
MLELAILGLLEDQELHGYEIRKRLRDELGLFSNISFGSLYPALSRLERDGAVRAIEDPGDDAGGPVPMTGSLSGERAALRARRASPTRGRRGRKVYRITDEGRRQFTVLLASESGAGSEDARSFGLRLAFARYLPPQARLRLLERRRAQLAQRLTETRAATGAGSRLDPYARSLVEHTTESTERDIAWLDRLIDAERSRAAHVTPAAYGHNEWQPEMKGMTAMEGMTQMEGEAR